jgi:hypothetical protein
VGKRLAEVRLHVCEGACAKDADEDRGLADLSGAGIDDRNGGTGVIDEAFLAGGVGEAKARFEVPHPLGVELAELAVAVALGVTLPILEPQQSKGHALLAKIGVALVPVRTWPLHPVRAVGVGEQQSLERGIPELVRQRPGEPRLFGFLKVFSDSACTDLATAGHLTVGEFALPLQTKDLADLAHGQPFLGQLSTSSVLETKGGRMPERKKVIQRLFAYVSATSEEFRSMPNTESGKPNSNSGT